MTRRPRHTAARSHAHADLVWLVAQTANHRITLTYLALGAIVVIALALMF